MCSCFSFVFVPMFHSFVANVAFLFPWCTGGLLFTLLCKQQLLYPIIALTTWPFSIQAISKRKQAWVQLCFRVERCLSDAAFTLVLFVFSDDQVQVTWFKHLHFQTANVWRLHCDPWLVYWHGGGLACWGRSIAHHANYPGCTGISRVVSHCGWVGSLLHPSHGSTFMTPKKEHSQVASAAWIIKEPLKALILSKLNLCRSCNVLRPV